MQLKPIPGGGALEASLGAPQPDGKSLDAALEQGKKQLLEYSHQAAAELVARFKSSLGGGA